MIEFKNLLQSRTVWANGVGLVSLLLSVLGFQSIALEREALVDAVLQVVTGVSFVASTLFRVIASKKIVL